MGFVHYHITSSLIGYIRAVGYIGAYPTVLYFVPLGLRAGYTHAVCGIGQINHTYSEDMHPEYPGMWFYPLATPRGGNHSMEDIKVHILLSGCFPWCCLSFFKSVVKCWWSLCNYTLFILGMPFHCVFHLLG